VPQIEGELFSRYERRDSAVGSYTEVVTYRRKLDGEVRVGNKEMVELVRAQSPEAWRNRHIVDKALMRIEASMSERNNYE
jgi:hypothetical protein